MFLLLVFSTDLKFNPFCALSNVFLILLDFTFFISGFGPFFMFFSRLSHYHNIDGSHIPLLAFQIKHS